MKRREWLFKYTAGKLATAATAKKDHHEERLKWWEKQKEAVMIKIRESGIDVHMPVADLYSNKTRGYGPEIVIDATMQRDLSEVQGKLIEHEAKVREYSGWVQVLDANPESQLELDNDDYLFFYGE